MSFSAVARALESPARSLLSTDLFDTVLLRDHTIESDRLATACRSAAAEIGVDPAALTRLRWSFQDTAYCAVAMERPLGDAALISICRVVVAALGRGEAEAQILRRAEVAVDIQHLRPNRPLLDALAATAAVGVRIIAVSDTYYAEDDLRHILDAVAGRHPIAAVYASADLGVTKHAGGLFAEVARREGVNPEQVVHIGDSAQADVEKARAAAWTAVHLPRDRTSRAKKLAGKALALPVKIRRCR